ncbi:hypothetical protein BDY19DRAFT_998995 [Irpex rosettiformis]|uniref:Uncharacterized protein n=1 Tax=Irpex rosettiformis TaxID=378272 RepID=A0ACB8TLS7_9APHY|nr:hypothetical protein BDY19DRAFT_998995 [Irpex rosettiformis]
MSKREVMLSRILGLTSSRMPLITSKVPLDLVLRLYSLRREVRIGLSSTCVLTSMNPLYGVAIGIFQRYDLSLLRWPPKSRAQDPEVRQLVDLETHLILSNGNPPIKNLVYTEEGCRIQHRIGTAIDLNEHCRLLIDLISILEFFNNMIYLFKDLPDDAVHVPAEYCESGAIDLYPQAFLGNKSHYQAGCLPAVFHPVIKKINSLLIGHDDEELARDSPVTGGSCQAYNSVLHHIRYQVQSHDVQLAEQTAFTASIFASSLKERNRAHALQEKIRSKDLVFARLQDKLRSPNINISLRMENVYHIDLAAINDPH